MPKKLLYAMLFLLPAVLLASSGEHETSRYFAQTGRHYDIGPRIFNFLVFAGLVYYLVASPIKAFFKGRKEGIAGQLNEIESKLQEAKEAQKSAEQALAESEVTAKEIIEESKKEAAMLAERLAESRKNDLELLDKLHEERIAHDERRMVKETIDTILTENITADDIPLTEKQVVEIIAGKVA